MPNLNEFFTDKDKEVDKGYNLEKLNGVRPCSKCREDVTGALWDPIEFVMSWKCSKGHENVFKVN